MGEIHSQPGQHFVTLPLMNDFRGSHVEPGRGRPFLRELRRRLNFFGWPLILVRQRVNWSLSRVLGECWRLLANIGTQREVLRFLAHRPFDEFAQDKPWFAFKYLIPDYIVLGFTVAERASCFLHHYRRMHSALPESTLRQILQGEVVLHQVRDGDNCFTVTIGMPAMRYDREGELSTHLRVNGVEVYSLSFIIVPGGVVGSDLVETLLITCLQGKKNCDFEMKLVRKVFYEYSPRLLLLAALQGFAIAFGIEELTAVCATNQRSYSKGHSTAFHHSYDEFFASLGMRQTAAGFYSAPVPIQGKSLESFEPKARWRARRRRAMRKQIESACVNFFSGTAGQNAASFSSAMLAAPVSEPTVNSQLSATP